VSLLDATGLQELGQKLSAELWNIEGVPFDGYVIYREQDRMIFRVFLDHDEAGRQRQCCTTFTEGQLRAWPSLRPITQALAYYAREARA
jgi:hypothetical protein